MNYADLSIHNVSWGFCVHLFASLLACFVVKIRQKAMKEKNEYLLSNKKKKKRERRKERPLLSDPGKTIMPSSLTLNSFDSF